MKIIDDKGRIFGKVNIFDLTVLIFLAFVLLTGYKYLYLRDWPTNILDIIAEPEDIERYVIVKSYVDEIIYNALKPELKELLFNETIAILKDFRPLPAEYEKPKPLLLVFQVKAKKKDNNIMYKSEGLIVGGSFAFNNEKLSLDGTILDVFQSDEEVKRKW